MIFCVVAGLVLSMNTATMDGSRALYGIAKDGMTIQQFGQLNKYRVPALAMTVDAILNILLISFFAGVLEILAVSNIGYVLRDVHGAVGLPAAAQGPARTGRGRSSSRASGCRSRRSASPRTSCS